MKVYNKVRYLHTHGAIMMGKFNAICKPLIPVYINDITVCLSIKSLKTGSSILD